MPSANASLVPLNTRVPKELRSAAEAFAAHLGKGAKLSDAVRTLLEAGLEACKEPGSFSLADALQAIDPTWTGGKPKFRKPVVLATRSGRTAVEIARARQQGRA